LYAAKARKPWRTGKEKEADKWIHCGDVRRNQWRYLTTDEAVQAALDWLTDERWLQAEEVGGTGPGTGRHTWRYFINPKVVKPNDPGNEHGELA